MANREVIVISDDESEDESDDKDDVDIFTESDNDSTTILSLWLQALRVFSHVL